MMPCTILPRVTVEAGPGLPFPEAPALLSRKPGLAFPEAPASLSRKPRPPSRKPRPPFAEAPASPHTVSTGQLPQWSSGTLPLDPADWSREEHFTRLGRWASSPSGLGGKLERAWAVRGLARNRRWPCFLQWRGQRGQRGETYPGFLLSSALPPALCYCPSRVRNLLARGLEVQPTGDNQVIQSRTCWRTTGRNRPA